jgi:hypothetical protein
MTMANNYNELIKSSKSIMDAYKLMVENAIPTTKPDDDEGISAWMNDVKKAHPGKMLSFRHRIEKGVHTTSAEVPGEDRSYGVWDHKDGEGRVLGEAVEKPELPAADDQMIPSSVKHAGKVYQTMGFKTPAGANAFMGSAVGVNYGFLMVDDQGIHHCAEMSDVGSAE